MKKTLLVHILLFRIVSEYYSCYNSSKEKLKKEPEEKEQKDTERFRTLTDTITRQNIEISNLKATFEPENLKRLFEKVLDDYDKERNR